MTLQRDKPGTAPSICVIVNRNLQLLSAFTSRSASSIARPLWYPAFQRLAFSPVPRPSAVTVGCHSPVVQSVCFVSVNAHVFRYTCAYFGSPVSRYIVNALTSASACTHHTLSRRSAGWPSGPLS